MGIHSQKRPLFLSACWNFAMLKQRPKRSRNENFHDINSYGVTISQVMLSCSTMKGASIWGFALCTHDCVPTLVCSQKLMRMEMLILLLGFHDLLLPLLATWAPHHELSSYIFKHIFKMFFNIYVFIICISNSIFASYCSHKTYVRMQEQMMVRLNVLTWEEITKDYSMSNAFYSLKPFFLTFKKIVSVFIYCSFTIYRNVLNFAFVIIVKN